DVVHRGAGVAVGEENLHRALEDADALGVGLAFDFAGCLHGSPFSIDKMTDFVKLSPPRLTGHVKPLPRAKGSTACRGRGTRAAAFFESRNLPILSGRKRTVRHW